MKPPAAAWPLQTRKKSSFKQCEPNLLLAGFSSYSLFSGSRTQGTQADSEHYPRWDASKLWLNALISNAKSSECYKSQRVSVPCKRRSSCQLRRQAGLITNRARCALRCVLYSCNCGHREVEDAPKKLHEGLHEGLQSNGEKRVSPT